MAQTNRVTILSDRYKLGEELGRGGFDSCGAPIYAERIAARLKELGQPVS